MRRVSFGHGRAITTSSLAFRGRHEDRTGWKLCSEQCSANAYRLRISLAGFQTRSLDIVVRTAVRFEVNVRLELASQQTTLTVEATADNLVENKPAVSGTVDRRLLAALPRFLQIPG